MMDEDNLLCDSPPKKEEEKHESVDEIGSDSDKLSESTEATVKKSGN
jgi:hypothetical protein